MHTLNNTVCILILILPYQVSTRELWIIALSRGSRYRRVMSTGEFKLSRPT